MNEVRNEKRVRKKKGAAGFAYSPNQRAALRLVPHTFVWADKDKELDTKIHRLGQHLPVVVCTFQSRLNPPNWAPTAFAYSSRHFSILRIRAPNDSFHRPPLSLS